MSGLSFGFKSHARQNVWINTNPKKYRKAAAMTEHGLADECTQIKSIQVRSKYMFVSYTFKNSLSFYQFLDKCEAFGLCIDYLKKQQNDEKVYELFLSHKQQIEARENDDDNNNNNGNDGDVLSESKKKRKEKKKMIK